MNDFAARSRVSRFVEDPDEAVGSGASATAPGRGGKSSGRQFGLAADGGDDDDDDDDKGDSGKGHGGMPVQDGVPLPWPARNREGKRNMVANAFWHGHLSDESINGWINDHMCTILLCGLLVMAGCASAWRWLFNRSMARVNPTNRSPFCSRHPAVCMRNRYYASLLRDYRHTRDAQLDPTGRRTTIKRGGNKLEECDPTTKLHYDDSRITEWWGHMLPGQEEGLYACPTPCSVAGERGEADVLVRMFEPTRRSEMSVRQKAAVINTEAHSLSKAGLEATDLLISYSRLADVVVGYSYGMKHGVPCTSGWGDCLSTAVKDSVSIGVPPRAPRSAGAVMFMSATCDRHEGYAAELVAELRREGGMGVDSFGRCFNSASEVDDPLYVEGRLGETKERISSQYRFQIVVENAIVDDYVSEKFYEGLKAGSLMVYLGAPNAASEYAPAPHSFVDASRFSSPAELSAYLHMLSSNETAYQDYFLWRHAGPSLAFKRKFENDLTRTDRFSWQCRLCTSFRTRYCP